MSTPGGLFGDLEVELWELLKSLSQRSGHGAHLWMLWHGHCCCCCSRRLRHCEEMCICFGSESLLLVWVTGSNESLSNWLASQYRSRLKFPRCEGHWSV